MKLVLVRHGATEWSATGQHTGRTDIPLTGAGIEQAKLAKRGLEALMGAEFSEALVFSSPLSRAFDTARLVMGDQRHITVSEDLREFDYGDYEGMTPAAIRELRPDWDIWEDGCPSGEDVESVGRRADSFLQAIDRADSVNVAFAHGHIIRILGARAVGLHAVQARIFTLNTAAISIVNDVRGIRVVELWNLDPAVLGS
jgi:probable phosphoglycerate mutase